MSKQFQELPTLPRFERWTAGYFRYLELTIVTSIFAIAAIKTKSPWLIAPTLGAVGLLSAWAYFGVLREVAKTLNEQSPSPNDYPALGRYKAMAFAIVALASVAASMGTLKIWELLSTAK